MQLLEDIGPGRGRGTPHGAAQHSRGFLAPSSGQRPLCLHRRGRSRALLRRRCCASSRRCRSCGCETGRSSFHAVLTRSEELVANLLPQYDGGPLARAVHQRLTGFTLDETRAYVHACLRGAGCDWAEELIPDDVIVDIQAFTQGVVGDVNAICCVALDAIATRTAGGNRQPKVTRAMLKEAGRSSTFVMTRPRGRRSPRRRCRRKPCT